MRSSIPDEGFGCLRENLFIDTGLCNQGVGNGIKLSGHVLVIRKITIM